MGKATAKVRVFSKTAKENRQIKGGQNMDFNPNRSLEFELISMFMTRRLIRTSPKA